MSDTLTCPYCGTAGLSPRECPDCHGPADLEGYCDACATAAVRKHEAETGMTVAEAFRLRVQARIDSTSAEIARLTAALSEAQRERDALKIEKQSSHGFGYCPRCGSCGVGGCCGHFCSFCKDRHDGEAWDLDGNAVAPRDLGDLTAKIKDAHARAEAAEAERDAAVKRAEEAEAAATTNANQYRLAYDRLTAAEARLALAERVVEAAGAFVDADPALCDHVMCNHEWNGCMDVLAALRVAVAEYRKAGRR